jgi:protein-L-isoaspartate O-methyltransferase
VTLPPAPSTIAYADAMLAIRDALDRQLSPLGLAAIAALAPRRGERILDIGCGLGQTVMQLAERVGPNGHVTGIDIEPKLVEAARVGAKGHTNVTVVTGDAAQVVLEREGFDALFSRFGVMGFHDSVAAFGNLRRGLRPHGRLAFVCWRGLKENELDALPLRAAALDVPPDPTPFRFERPDYLEATLARAGFRSIAIRSRDTPVSCGDVDATMAVVMRVGALGRILRTRPDLAVEAVEDRVRAALAELAEGKEVWLNAAIWVVSADL